MNYSYILVSFRRTLRGFFFLFCKNAAKSKKYVFVTLNYKDEEHNKLAVFNLLVIEPRQKHSH